MKHFSSNVILTAELCLSVIHDVQEDMQIISSKAVELVKQNCRFLVQLM